MTTQAHELDAENIEWDSLAPPCEAGLCKNNPAELICLHRHFDPGNCNQEGRQYLLCKPCYEWIKRATTVCYRCLEPASCYAEDTL